MMRGDDGTLFEKLPKKSQLLKFIYASIPLKRGGALKKAHIFCFQFWMKIFMLSKLHDS